jgi:hypothetical protein
MRAAHAKLFQALKGFMDSTLTLQSHSATQDAFGEKERSWVNVSGAIDLPCAVGSRTGREWVSMTGQLTVDYERDTIAILAGRVDASTDWRAIVNGADTYSISGVAYSHGGESTQLTLKRVV